MATWRDRPFSRKASAKRETEIQPSPRKGVAGGYKFIEDPGKGLKHRRTSAARRNSGTGVEGRRERPLTILGHVASRLFRPVSGGGNGGRGCERGSKNIYLG